MRFWRMPYPVLAMPGSIPITMPSPGCALLIHRYSVLLLDTYFAGSVVMPGTLTCTGQGRVFQMEGQHSISWSAGASSVPSRSVVFLKICGESGRPGGGEVSQRSPAWNRCGGVLLHCRFCGSRCGAPSHVARYTGIDDSPRATVRMAGCVAYRRVRWKNIYTSLP